MLKSLSQVERENIFINKWYTYINENLLTNDDRKQMHKDVENLNLDYQEIIIKMMNMYNESLKKNR